MKKRNKKFNPQKHLKARPPMMVMREIVNTDLESKEYAALIAFKFGAAEKYHYDLLLDITNLLLIAGSSDKSRSYATNVANKHFIPALKGIKDRYDRTGKLGVSAAEINILSEIVEFSKQFWNRQPIELYDTACRELKAYYDSLKTDKEIAYARV
jgi:hypothetical protein